MDHWRQGGFLLCLSDDITAEYLEVLARFPDVESELHEFLLLVAEERHILFVYPVHQLTVVADPDDDMFLECAVAAQADVIASGDRHLLALGRFRGIPIQTPAEFLASLRSK